MERPDQRELDEEIRGHLALSIRERIERGEDPATARREALRELGYVGEVRESMRRVWYSRSYDACEALAQDVRIGLRSLLRAKGLSATVVVTLALGIGANAAVFSVVRGVLLQPLVNREEDRLLYIRQTAPGAGIENLTFSIPEIRDLTRQVPAIADFGDFSTTDLTLVGFGEPRIVRAGVVSGSYFHVMGLRPVAGRLLDARDDGPDAPGAAVLTFRFWTTAFGRDPGAVGRTIRLGPRTATIVGVLEPSVPYPADTEIIANVVTSPHHLGATMVTERTHRMTELFGRLAPGATSEDARAQLTAAHAAMMGTHPEAYPESAEIQLRVRPLREQITAPARPILLILLAAAALVFLIACSNVASLVLARSVRREGELIVRAALGATPGALRRTLFAESLVLCGAGAALGVVLAHPLLGVVTRFASRFSIRALDVSVDATLLWTGAGLALLAAVLLAYIPRLPSSQPRLDRGGAPAALRLTQRTGRRLRTLAVAQMALTFVLLAGAGALVTAFLAVRAAQPGYEARRVLAVEVPSSATGVAGAPVVEFLYEAMRRIAGLPGVAGVAAASFMPSRDTGAGMRFQFDVEGYTPAEGEDHPYGGLRIVSPGFFAVLGGTLLAGRDFTDEDRADREPVVIVSQSLAQRLFPNGDALDRTLWWIDPVLGGPVPRRIVGIVADLDDENLVPVPVLTVYHPLRQMGYGSRLFVRAAGDAAALAPAVTDVIRDISAEQAVEHVATLEQVRAEVLAPERVNAFVLSVFAGIALLIAGVGLAGVLAFSVSARMQEFGVRLAMGASRRDLLGRVLADGALIVAAGVAAGAVAGHAFASVAAHYAGEVRVPGVVPLVGAAAVLAIAALVASLMPATRASRVDVLQALRVE